MSKSSLHPDSVHLLSTAGVELSQGRTVRVTLDSKDMRPFFRDGKDFVVLAPIRRHASSANDAAIARHDKVSKRKRATNRSCGENRMTVRRRDIVLVRHEDELRIRRVVHIWGTLLLLRGDSSYGALERATVSDVIGVVVGGSILNGHTFNASSASWRIVSRLWCATYRLRYWASRTRRKLR